VCGSARGAIAERAALRRAMAHAAPRRDAQRRGDNALAPDALPARTAAGRTRSAPSTAAAATSGPGPVRTTGSPKIGHARQPRVERGPGRFVHSVMHSKCGQFPPSSSRHHGWLGQQRRHQVDGPHEPGLDAAARRPRRPGAGRVRKRTTLRASRGHAGPSHDLARSSGVDAKHLRASTAPAAVIPDATGSWRTEKQEGVVATATIPRKYWRPDLGSNQGLAD
jgi:hypothetical protein